MSEAKQREVLQLLRYYRDWHTAYGGASELNLESLGQYGPAGMILAGQPFDKENFSYLEESFGALEEALTRLRNGGPLKNAAYLVLLAPYLGDPADSSLVDKWRQNPKDCRTEWHDLAIKELAWYLRNTDLFVPKTSRMQTRKPSSVKQMNDEFYSLYEKLREEGEKKTKAVETAANWCNYGLTRAWEIVKLREGASKSG